MSIISEFIENAKEIKRKEMHRSASLGAENETRTRDPDLGKVVLYQLSYFRVGTTKVRTIFMFANFFRFFLLFRTCIPGNRYCLCFMENGKAKCLLKCIS